MPWTDKYQSMNKIAGMETRLKCFVRDWISPLLKKINCKLEYFPLRGPFGTPHSIKQKLNIIYLSYYRKTA